MNVRQLRNLLNSLPDEYTDRPVFYCTEFHDAMLKPDFDSELLTDVSEFAVDTDDNVIVLRGSVGY